MKRRDFLSAAIVAPVAAAELVASTTDARAETIGNFTQRELDRAGLDDQTIRILKDNGLLFSQSGRLVEIHAPDFSPSQFVFNIDDAHFLSVLYGANAEYQPLPDRSRSNVSSIRINFALRSKSQLVTFELKRVRQQTK